MLKSQQSLFAKVFSDALPIAIVGYSTNLSLAKIFSARKGFDWSANQEGFALGAAHLVSSFFSCFPGSAALARRLGQFTPAQKLTNNPFK